MKTAEVAIEYMLTGLLALCAFGLPLLSKPDLDQRLLQSGAIIGVLGMAYLLGVVFDKLADSVLSPIEQWLRLRQADENFKNTKKHSDAFPQDALELTLRGEDGRLEWMDSLRGRIRTTRGLAVLGLPAAMGIAIFQGFMKDDGAVSDVSWRWLLYTLVFVNLLFIVGSIWRLKTKKFRTWFKFLKTRDLTKDDDTRITQMRKAKQDMWRGIRLYVLMLLTSTVTVIIIAALRAAHFESVVIGMFGAVAALLALWTWYSITKTYISFISKAAELLTEERITTSLRKGNPTSQSS
jgi:hypothetical protein